MTKDVLINISGLQMELDDGEPVEMMTTGDYYLKNGKHFIQIRNLNRTIPMKGMTSGQPARRMELPSSCGARWPSL